MKYEQVIEHFIQRELLPSSYLDAAIRWFFPLAEVLKQKHGQFKKPIVCGINGCQGSGKSTVAGLLVELLRGCFECKSVAISIDDFYLTASERAQLGKDVHPLLQTRGVPGTHDMELATQTLNQLMRNAGQIMVPRFDKAIDDRFPNSEWTPTETPIDILIIEGWCLGAIPQDEGALIKPINELEEKEDPDGQYRRYVNARLGAEYAMFFGQVDYWVMLQAPSFDCVYQWRLQQEDKLRRRAGDTSGKKIMSAEELKRFIQFYQRITEHTLLTLPSRADWVYELGEDRTVHGIMTR
ncbi:hypothetical protein [Marinibactrum halimedae]|uniref:Kinase n=1 Tax=Marinibactrum halimedae TaxID=1444977 RepID=A0AA37T5I9_9GAMM|nr:hypothetical protein [Marinibactrum halimedae]MCD9458653.1 hypothetical protein [Marinibactrum halimedae]GLS25981.1 kinase [Marinibactrum halimedae]